MNDHKRKRYYQLANAILNKSNFLLSEALKKHEISLQNKNCK